MPAPHIRPTLLALVALALTGVVLAGCGSGGGEGDSRPAPSAQDFPSAKGKNLDEIVEESGAKKSNLVIAPAALSFVRGENRFPVGVFTVGGKQIQNVDVAFYFAKGDKSKDVIGPLPAYQETLEVKPAYRAATSGAEGDATSVYVVPKVDLKSDGNWTAIAMLKGKDGLEASLLPSVQVGGFPKIPEDGEKPPAITTLTAADVGDDLEKIDTRIPPDQMHKYDFADVLGKKPIVLMFATPALCQTRVCGPVADVAQQVADKYEPEVAFIHQEVYVDNEIEKGVRPQLKEFGLETEPWTFVIGKDGRVSDRIEGAFGVKELEKAVQQVLPKG
jgi:hypothetical protein